MRECVAVNEWSPGLPRWRTEGSAAPFFRPAIVAEGSAGMPGLPTDKTDAGLLPKHRHLSGGGRESLW